MLSNIQINILKISCKLGVRFSAKGHQTSPLWKSGVTTSPVAQTSPVSSWKTQWPSRPSFSFMLPFVTLVTCILCPECWHHVFWAGDTSSPSPSPRLQQLYEVSLNLYPGGCSPGGWADQYWPGLQTVVRRGCGALSSFSRMWKASSWQHRTRPLSPTRISLGLLTVPTPHC